MTSAVQRAQCQVMTCMKRDCRTCQQRCGPHGVRRFKRLERLADDLESCCIRQAPELLQAVGDAQRESVAVSLALDLDAGLYCKGKGRLSKPAKRLTRGKSRHGLHQVSSLQPQLLMWLFCTIALPSYICAS